MTNTPQGAATGPRSTHSFQIIHTDDNGRVFILASCTDRFAAECALPRETEWAKREGYAGAVTIRELSDVPAGFISDQAWSQ